MDEMLRPSNETDGYDFTEATNMEYEMASYSSSWMDTNISKEKDSNYVFQLFALPSELVFAIVSVLPPRDLFAIAKVCKDLRDMSKLCWKTACMKDYQFEPQPFISNSEVDWKEYYHFRKQIMKPGAFEWQVLQRLTGDYYPTPRMAHTGVAFGNKIVYIGGQLEDKIRYNDIYIFNTDTLEFTKPTVEGDVPRFARHVAVGIGNKVYCFGGYNGFGTYYKLSVYDIEQRLWYEPSTKGIPPIPRTNHAAAVVGKKMYIYGGNYTPHAGTERADEEYTILGDLHVFDTETMTWSNPAPKGPQPGPRTAHTLVGIGKNLFLFGGGVWQPRPDRWIKKFNDIWTFNTDTEEWCKPQTYGTIPVCSFPVSFTISHWIFFFGGQKLTEHNITNELYCFDTVSGLCTHFNRQQVLGDLPNPRDLGTASYVNGKVFMFAGSSGTPVNDLDILTWNTSPVLAAASKASI